MKKESQWHQLEGHPWVARLEIWGRKFLYRSASLFFKQKKGVKIHLSSIQKILLIKEPYRMGDLFQITPILHALKTQYPKLKVALVIQDRNLPVFENNPHIDDLFLFKKKEINRQPWKFFSFLSQIRSQQYDCAVALETERCHLTNDIIALLSGAYARVRYDGIDLGDPDSNAFYNLLIPYDRTLRHEVDRNGQVLKSLGLELKDRNLQFFCSDSESKTASHLFKELQGKKGSTLKSKNVLIHPGSYKAENRWPLKNFLKLGYILLQREIGVLFSLGPSEADWKSEIQQAGFSTTKNLPLGTLAALMREFDLALCNDTGIMHLASACRVPTVALFGQTDPARWKPPQNSTVALVHPKKKIASITIESVLDQIIKMI